MNWMSWAGGVDVAGGTEASATMPNVIVHVARMVHTPIGATPAGLVFLQPDASKPPIAFGFVCEDIRVGAYFGSKIFAGTPFETAPVLAAKISISDNDAGASATVHVGGLEITTRLGGLGEAQLIHRAPGPMPFAQQGIERPAANVGVFVDGTEIKIIIPKIGMSGGPGAVLVPCGLYAR